MASRAIALLALLFAVMAFAQDIRDPQHCLFGCPDGSSSTNDLVMREIYIVSSRDLRSGEIVREHLSPGWASSLFFL